MNKNEAIKRLEEIQRIAERTTLYTLLPGTAAIIGGMLALAGCAVSYLIMHSLDFSALAQCSKGTQIQLVAMWIAICLAAVILEIVLAARDARKHGFDPFGRSGKVAAYSLTPSILIALLITVRIVIDLDEGQSVHLIRYIPPVWMMCYGCGVYAAGLFSIRLPRALGIGFIVLGGVNLLFTPTMGLLMTALSFGLLHIIFGCVVLVRNHAVE